MVMRKTQSQSQHHYWLWRFPTRQLLWTPRVQPGARLVRLPGLAARQGSAERQRSLVRATPPPRKEGEGFHVTGASHTRESTRLSPSTYGLLAARDPALSAFRNCIASYSAREVGKDVDETWADLLIRATEGECRARFDDMAQMLSKRFGEKRVEPVMQQLIETTLLPAAKSRGKPDGRALPVPSQ
jgi:hypothetical protein